MATWSISPDDGEATVDSSGVFSATTNPTESPRSWTVTYTDDNNNTASTVITQDGCRTCPTGVTPVSYSTYSIETLSSGEYDYKIIFDTSAMDANGVCTFFVDAAYYDGQQGRVEDCSCVYEGSAGEGLDATINYADECTNAEVSGDYLEDDEYSVGIDCYQYGANANYGDNTRSLSLDVTNLNTNVSKKILVEMHNPIDEVGVEFIFSGDGWNTLINSVKDGNQTSLTENSHGYGSDVGLVLETFPSYQLRTSNHDSCTSFYGHLPYNFRGIELDTSATGPMTYDKRIYIHYPENTSIENTDWQNLYIRYIPSLTASTDTNIDSMHGMNFNGGGRYTLQYNGKQITLNQQGYNPTTNIPIPRWITPSKARTLFWGEYGPSLGQGNIFAVMVQIPENPLTENVKVIYYLQTEDD